MGRTNAQKPTISTVKKALHEQTASLAVIPGNPGTHQPFADRNYQLLDIIHNKYTIYILNSLTIQNKTGSIVIFQRAAPPKRNTIQN